jgi:peptidoglycan glycosyltransferase
MNAPITRLFGVVVILFTILIVWTTRWTVFDSKALQNNQLNARTLIDELKIKRGRILADDGTVLAKSVRGPGHTWDRTYPTGSLFAQAVGFSNIRQGQATGLELSRGRELRGIQTGLSSVFGQLGGSTQVGDDVYTTLDPKAQELARTLLAGRTGSVVALDPRTGAVKVMYANPSYDNNHPQSTANGATTFDRSLQANYPPGSTFKVVTTAAALDSGKYTPNSIINGNSPVTVSGVPLENDGNQSWGPISLTTALTNSVNTVFAKVGEALGRQTMTEYMKRFGFYAKPPLDFPPLEMGTSGAKAPNGNPLLPTSSRVDLGRTAIGQDKLAVTPMQMAMVAAAVANHGTLMAPHLTSRVVNQDGQTVETIKPRVYSNVMKPSTAAELAKMMTNVVDEGTGTPARLEGISVAGKTGTASVSPPGTTQPWFICFAPVGNPKVAVAVTIEKTPGEFGGQVAAPIAAQIVKQLLSEGQ